MWTLGSEVLKVWGSKGVGPFGRVVHTLYRIIICPITKGDGGGLNKGKGCNQGVLTLANRGPVWVRDGLGEGWGAMGCKTVKPLQKGSPVAKR